MSIRANRRLSANVSRLTASASGTIAPALTASLGNTNSWYERSQNVVWQYLGSVS